MYDIIDICPDGQVLPVTEAKKRELGANNNVWGSWGTMISSSSTVFIIAKMPKCQDDKSQCEK